MTHAVYQGTRSSSYEPEPVPSQVSPEYLERELRRISDALKQVVDFVPAEEPARNPDSAQLRYFDATKFDPGLGTGFYAWVNGGWNLVTLTPVP